MNEQTYRRDVRPLRLGLDEQVTGCRRCVLDRKFAQEKLDNRDDEETDTK